MKEVVPTTSISAWWPHSASPGKECKMTKKTLTCLPFKNYYILWSYCKIRNLLEVLIFALLASSRKLWKFIIMCMLFETCWTYLKHSTCFCWLKKFLNTHLPPNSHISLSSVIVPLVSFMSSSLAHWASASVGLTIYGMPNNCNNSWNIQCNAK